MPESNSENKRQAERLKLILPVKYLNLNSNKEGQAKLRDISDKGIGLVTDEALPVDTPLDIWLQMPDGGCVYVRGEVAWVKELGSDNYMVGIKLSKEELKSMQLAIRAMQALTEYYP